MVSAVIFDFYGTLAHTAEAAGSNYQTSYQTIFAAHGYTLDQAVLDDYYSRYDGVEHGEHSISEEAYEAWVRTRLRDLAGACGVSDAHVEELVDALRESTRETMVPYPEAAATLLSLREAGLAIGVCSNWGWELDEFLDQMGLLELVDVSVTSARAGARKPHPDIYGVSVSAWESRGGGRLRRRLVGARCPGAATGRHGGSARLARGRAHGLRPPPLEPGDHRVGDLAGVLEIVDGLRRMAHRRRQHVGVHRLTRCAAGGADGCRGYGELPTGGRPFSARPGGQGLPVVVGERDEADVGVAEGAPPHQGRRRPTPRTGGPPW